MGWVLWRNRPNMIIGEPQIHAEVKSLETHAIEKGLSITIELPNVKRYLGNVLLARKLESCLHQFSSVAVTPEIHLHSNMMNIDHAVGKHKGITRPPHNLAVEITNRLAIDSTNEYSAVSIIQHPTEELGHFIQIWIHSK